MPHGNAFGELAFISCTSGYVIRGETYITCLENGVWSDNTTCLRGITSINFELLSGAVTYHKTFKTRVCIYLVLFISYFAPYSEINADRIIVCSIWKATETCVHEFLTVLNNNNLNYPLKVDISI